MFFSDMEGNFLSEFHVGDLRPNTEQGAYCSAHMGMAVMGIRRDLLVNAWYTGGVDVIDFSRPTRLRETAYFDMRNVGGQLVRIPVHGPDVREGPGIPVYASDGLGNVNAGSMLALRAKNIPGPRRKEQVDHLNPQTMDHMMMGRGDDDDDDDDDDDRGKGRGRDRDRDDDD